jgi:hypothetical protein
MIARGMWSWVPNYLMRQTNAADGSSIRKSLISSIPGHANSQDPNILWIGQGPQQVPNSTLGIGQWGSPGQLVFCASGNFPPYFAGSFGLGFSGGAATLPDVSIIRDAAGSLELTLGPSGNGVTNGQFMTWSTRTELTTVSTAATTNTAIQFPANSMQLGVSVRVVTAIPTAATFNVGTTENATRYGSGIAVAGGTTNATCGTTNPIILTSTAPVVITPNVATSAPTGQVRVTLYYIALTPPTA